MDAYFWTSSPKARCHPNKRGFLKTAGRRDPALEEWVESGAAWPSDRVLDLYEATSDVRAGRDWWSLQPVKRPAVPLTGHPVDAFVRAS